MASRKTIQLGDEPALHRSHQRRRRQRLPAVFAKRVHRPEGALQPRDINIQIHPVDRLYRQPHMIGDNRRDILCYHPHPVVRFCPSGAHGPLIGPLEISLVPEPVTNRRSVPPQHASSV
jgi:hypothetical protein